MKISEFLNSITNSVGRMVKNVRYRNLVFKGGGVRGIAYMGALEALEEQGILQNIERVAGSSAGAIAATLASFRLPVSETVKLFDSLDLASVPQNSKSSSKEGKLPRLKNADNVRRLIEKFGWYSSSYFHKWLGEVIASQCGRNPRATFIDFHLRGYRDLHVVADNLSRKRTDVFSYETTPNVAVADAVRLSMSIPLFFEAARFDGKEFGKGDYYLDGGLFDNYPILLFDQPQFAHLNPFYKNGINWETLGLFLQSDEMVGYQDPLMPENLYEFLNLIIRRFYDAHDISNLDKSLVDQKRSVLINDCGVPPFQFDLEPGSELYQKLYSSGKKSVINFLNSK
ncbi:MAG: patatin-like phospholipase family protein [Pelolinea sp.]|nr:patatin-like phospholipase family protein [Pelolinea sp.]